MNLVLLTIALTLGWCAGTGSLAIGNLLLGLVLAGLGLYVVRTRLSTGAWIRPSFHTVALAGLFASELMLSAIRVAILVVRPDMKQRLRAELVEFPLTLTADTQITLLANLITLTPGTLSVDVSDDRKTLLVHAIDVPDREALIRELREGFEAAVARAFQ